jgi:hypothetical protein
VARDAYIRLYHLARERAKSDLVNRHRDEFAELFEVRKGELDGWPNEDPEIPVAYLPSSPEETLRRAKEIAGARRAKRNAQRVAEGRPI